MGVWDALGHGISGGVQAYLTGKRRQEEEKRYASAESMGKERLALEQFQARTGLEQYEDRAALDERLRAEERHEAYDPRTDPSRDIFIPMFETLAEGSFVPLSQERRDQMYAEQLAAWEAKETGLTGEAHERERELIEYRAKMGHQYSYPPRGADQEEPDYVRTLYREGILDSEIAGVLTIRALQQFMPDGLPINPAEIFRGPRGAQMAQDVATYVAQLAQTYYPDRNVYADFMRYLEGYTSDRNPPPPPVLTRTPTPQQPSVFTEGDRQMYTQKLESAPNFPGVRQALQNLAPPVAQPDAMMSAHGAPPPMPEKTLQDFKNEIVQQQPHLAGMPAAVDYIANQRYQEYRQTLR